jgi:hypothetical protein
VTAWTLYYHDLFDPESGGEEATGTELLDGFELMWRKEAAEGILDDGARSFSTFTLQWAGGRADLPLKRANPGLLRIREWACDDDGLPRAVAAAHLGGSAGGQGAAREAAARIFALAERCAGAAEFTSALADSVRDSPSW